MNNQKWMDLAFALVTAIYFAEVVEPLTIHWFSTNFLAKGKPSQPQPKMPIVFMVWV
jgi:hypothetical protein